MGFKLTLACLVIVAVLTAQATKRHETIYGRAIQEESNNPIRHKARDPERFWKNFLQRRSCVALGGTGCEGNNGKCCRKGNPYTGTMRKCANVGSFSGPVYKCVEQ